MLTEKGRVARASFRQMANIGTNVKNGVLRTLAKLIAQTCSDVLAANNKDVEAARASGMTDALIDRLTLTEKLLEGLSSDLCRLAELPDPVGQRFDETVLSNGLKLWKQRVPLGVIGVIYESR